MGSAGASPPPGSPPRPRSSDSLDGARLDASPRANDDDAEADERAIDDVVRSLVRERSASARAAASPTSGADSRAGARGGGGSPGRVAAGAGAPRGAGPPIRFIGATERGGGPLRRATGKNAPPTAAAAKKRAPLAGVNPAYVLDERHARGVHGASHDEGSTTRRPSGEAAGSPRASPSGSSVPPPSSVLTLETILARCGATSPAECYRADVSGCALARVADEDDDAAEVEEDEEEERSRSRSRSRVVFFPRVRLSVLPLAPYLAHLDASDNDLRWRDLATLSRLSALRRVSLAANRLGDDSDSDSGGDEGSRGARLFALGGEETSGGGFVPFRSLTSLDLAHNDIGHEALAALSRLPRLETLSLASCRVRALPAEAFFRVPPRARRGALRGDEESEEDASEVFFPRLRSLDLSRQTSAAGDPNSHDALRASACDFLDVLGAMPRLERLSLRRNARLDAFPFPTLSSRAVHVRSSPLRAGVDFPSLVFLDLRDSGVARPEALQPLAALGAGRPGGRLREVALAGTDAATRLTRDAEARGAEFFKATQTAAVTQRRASAAAVAARRRGAVAAGALRVVASLCDADETDWVRIRSADESFAPSPRVIGDGENINSFSDDDQRVCVAVALEEHAPSHHSASGAFITLEPPANISRARANASGANAPRFDFVRMRDAFGYRPRSLAETKARFRLVAEADDEDPLGVNDPDAIVRGLVAKTERTLAIGARRELAKDYRVAKGREARALAKARDAEARERERREAWENGEFAKAYRERAARKKTEETGEAGGERARKTKAGEAAKDVLAAAAPKKERAPEGEAPEDVFGYEDGKERPTVVPGFFEPAEGEEPRATPIRPPPPGFWTEARERERREEWGRRFDAAEDGAAPPKRTPISDAPPTPPEGAKEEGDEEGDDHPKGVVPGFFEPAEGEKPRATPIRPPPPGFWAEARERERREEWERRFDAAEGPLSSPNDDA
jgi:hypothetical protein